MRWYGRRSNGLEVRDNFLGVLNKDSYSRGTVKRSRARLLVVPTGAGRAGTGVLRLTPFPLRIFGSPACPFIYIRSRPWHFSEKIIVRSKELTVGLTLPVHGQDLSSAEAQLQRAPAQ